MEAFLVSAGIVAIAEIGDKTQLLALVLAARYRKPIPIILGILLATVANHAAAAAFGSLVAVWAGGEVLRWALGLSFLAMAAWVLVPDKADGDDDRSMAKAGPFLATLVAFFVVEIGDKTQVATIALAAHFADVLTVTAGTTAGMMLANVPAVLLGEVAATKVPMGLVRGVASAVFAALGALALMDVGGAFAGLSG